MAERKTVNKYYPPDWDPRKGSANKRVGQHPLRDRAKKLSQGILVIRFELPYNIWCGGCGSHIGMGVRYNAEKSKVGNYYTTPIYKFRMKCHLCDNYFEIQTDPKNHDYVILSGARRKEQRWDPVENEQIVPEDKATQKKLATDPMYKLEHGSDDHQKGKDKVMSLAQIEESRISMLDDYYLNRRARDKFRAEKKQLKESAETDRAIIERASLSINLVEESEEDIKLAGLMKYSVTSSFEDRQREKRNSIEQQSIFSTGGSPLLSSLSVSPSSLNALSNQKHSPATLSQHGDLKHTLGRVLQKSYKDPFKFAGKKSGMSQSSFSKSNPSRLGIKLKSSHGNRCVSSELSQNKKNVITGVLKKSSEHGEIITRQVCNPESAINSNVPTSSLSTFDVSAEPDCVPEDETKYKSTDSASILPNKALQVVCAPMITLITTDAHLPPPLAAENNNCYNQLKWQLNVSPSQTQEHTDKTEQSVYSTSPVSTGKLGVGKSTDADLSNINNTGLQTLLCNYTDSDSESSS